MTELVDVQERSFSNLAELKAHLDAKERRYYQVSLNELLLGKDSILRSDRFEAKLTESGFQGLLGMLNIPWRFARKICPPELVRINIKRLSRDNPKPARIQIVDNIVTAVMPSDRRPIDHVELIDWLGDQPIQQATINQSSLRITMLTQESEELLAGDVYGFGWEMVNREDGWRPTEAWRYVLREICSNGLIGPDRTAYFCRYPVGRESVAESLEKLYGILDNTAEVEVLATAVKWAVEQQIGSEREDAVKYLSQHLDGTATRLALESITSDASWYDLLNNITSSARLYQLDMRRRYELQGGRLLNWYRSQGRERAPWRRVSCERCKYLLGD
ncbi:MAG: hypothetical protein NTX52_11860 [Planctomycetota bacterium]|nr:hypothetical protein [Planctomycetota bacterium]